MEAIVEALYTLWYNDEIKDTIEDTDKLAILREISKISMKDPFWLSAPENKYTLNSLPDKEMTGSQMYILMTCIAKDLGFPVAS